MIADVNTLTLLICFGQIREPNIFKVTQNFKPVVVILKTNIVVIGHSLLLSQKIVIKIN